MAKVRVAAQGATATVVRAGSQRIRAVRSRQSIPAAPGLFLQIFNTSAPTVGTTAPALVLPVPAGRSLGDGEVLNTQFSSNRGSYILGTGLSFAVTTTHDGATGPTAGQEPMVEIDYTPND